MKKTFFLISVIILIFHFKATANRSLYVNNFSNILGNKQAENDLLHYAQLNKIETLLLYEFYLIVDSYDLSNPTSNFILAEFISKAKTKFNIKKVGVIAENSNLFEFSITPYNNSRNNDTEKVDIFNLEFEFWRSTNVNSGEIFCNQYLAPNGFSCNNKGGFKFFISTLKKMKSLAKNNSHPVSIEAYVGWLTKKQARIISKSLDKILVHAYVSTPKKAYAYSKERIMNLAKGKTGLNVSIIFESEPKYMQTWLKENSMIAAENIFLVDWNNEPENWKNKINLKGFTYFKYTSNINVQLMSN